jgi:S-methylmethionine-dependent homocysteine/selenocysteine methylase
MTYALEAIGVAKAASAVDLPVVISFTVETDGRLPSGQSLGDAIAEVDEATSGAPAYYMVNCAHPTHFAMAIDAGAAWARRIQGIRANASRLSHAELDASTELDRGDIVELAQLYQQLGTELRLCVVGGCCGTDHEHIDAIAAAFSRSAVAGP